ncbi:response regulator [Streptomyces sp. NPDC008141]|uniref:response regulator n=1 Tax=Streptomyces sp. NPDC008141 TaxID=3364815 RepID=UPI0036E87452
MPDEHSRTSGQHWSHQSHASQHTSSHTSDELPALPEQLPAAISPLRVVVADDNPVVRAGLTVLLQGRDDLDVVAEAADGREACEAAVRHRPDVILLDVRMPGVDGLAALPHLVRLAPVLMMTYSRESEIVHEALRLGAGGYLVHGEFTADQLVAAVRDIKAGRATFTHSASGALLAGVRSGRQCAQPSSLTQANVAHSSSGPDVAGELRGVITALSQREVEVMDLIASGMTNQQIAASCFISQKTVKNHINRIFAKLNAGSRGEAIAVWRSLARGGSA